MKHLYNFFDFILEEVNEFKDFTPLYHISFEYFQEILQEDMLRVGYPMRGPVSICITRSKEFSHDNETRGATPRFILNRELLARDGYRSYPVDEWALMGGVEHPLGLNIEPEPEPTKKPWYSPELVKKYHYGKSQFQHTKSGRRPVSHGIPSIITKGFATGLEVEYEERILKDIKNLGKYIYALNFMDEDELDIYREVVKDYLKKYPHIKVLLGSTEFVEMETGYYVVETDETENITMKDNNTLKCGETEIALPEGNDWEILRIEQPKRKYQKTKVVLKGNIGL